MTFIETVYKITSEIPLGKVATYGQIAKLAEKPKASRVVGRLMKTNPYAPKVPCHRVVGWDGSLIGYSVGKGLITKKELLIKESVAFIGDKVDLSISQWHLSLT